MDIITYLCLTIVGLWCSTYYLSKHGQHYVSTSHNRWLMVQYLFWFHSISYPHHLFVWFWQITWRQHWYYYCIAWLTFVFITIQISISATTAWFPAGIFLVCANLLSINFNCCAKHVQLPIKTWSSSRIYVSQSLADGAVSLWILFYRCREKFSMQHWSFGVNALFGLSLILNIFYLSHIVFPHYHVFVRW